MILTEKVIFTLGPAERGKREFFRCEGVFLLVVTEKWKK